MRIFINNVDSYVGTALCADLRRSDGIANRIFGTVTGDSGGVIPACVRRPVPRSNMKLLLKTLLSCSLVVYDVHNADYEEVEFILRALKDTELENNLTFVLISSLMTWTKTPKKYLSAEQPDFEEGELGEGVEDDMPPVEEEQETDEAEVEESDVEAPKPKRPKPFRGVNFDQRVAPSHFSSWKSLETLTLALNTKENLKAFVVGSGMFYGCGESALFSMFKSAWLGHSDAVVIGPGNNYIPMVHVRDCARLVKTIAQGNVPEEERYLVCVDRSDMTQKKLVRGIVDKIGTTSYKVPTDIAPEQAILSDLAELLTVDLRFRPCAPMLSSDFAWWCKNGIFKEINKVAAEFEKVRQLRPVRVAILGAPAVGKSTHAAILAKTYNVPVVTVSDAIKYAESGKGGATLKEKLDNFRTEAEEKAVESAAASAPPAKGKAGQTGLPPAPAPVVVRYPTNLVGECIKAMLKTNACRFRGFVLDGFPRTYEEAEAAFLCPAPRGEGEEEEAVEEEEEVEEGEEKAEGEGRKEKLVLDTLVVPHFIVQLTGSDEFCKSNVQKMMASTVSSGSNDHNNEAGFARRLAIFKANWTNPSVPIPLEFFSKWRLTDMTKSVENQSIEDIQKTLRILVESKGLFNNFLPPPQQINAALKQKAAEKAEQRSAEAAAVAAKMANEEFLNQQRRSKEDEDRLKQIEAHEKQLLEAQSLPLRAYLMTFVVPALTEGLVEIARVAPEDPIDYLAEFLFTRAREIEAAGGADPADFVANMDSQEAGTYVPMSSDM